MKRIEKDLKNWISKYLGDGPYVVMGDDIYYNCVDDYIMISTDMPEHIEGYIRYADKLGLDYTLELPWYVICFLHELGHAETMYDIPEYKITFDSFIKSFVETASYTQFGADLKSQIYYRLPVEREATKWMVEFANYNRKAIKELVDIMSVYF